MPPQLAADSDPAADPVGTVRVHPADDPSDPHARRAVRTRSGMALYDERPWCLLTARPGARVDDLTLGLDDGRVDDWPVQPWWHLAVVLGHDPIPEGL